MTDWALLRQHARLQSELLTRPQCLAAGMTDRALRWRVRSGRWRRLHPGVYLTAPGRQDWMMTATAAMLAAQSGGRAADAALWGASAAHLWGLLREPPSTIELAVPAARTLAAPAGSRLRRIHHWDERIDDLAYPWRATVEEAALAVAARSGPDGALAIVASAVQRELTTSARLRASLELTGRHRHGALLREALGDIADGAQSTAEIRYIRDVERAHGLPPASRQVRAGGAVIHDNGYADYGLFVEVDGRLGHETWRDRVRDGRRDRLALPAHGVTVRVFWSDVAVTPCATAGELEAILVARGWAGRVHRCRRRGCPHPARP